jgi:hypothetical protein
MIAAKPEVILKNIKHWIEVKDKLVNSPIGDLGYTTTNELAQLVVDRLYDLQGKYRKVAKEYSFNWMDLQ